MAAYHVGVKAIAAGIVAGLRRHSALAVGPDGGPTTAADLRTVVRAAGRAGDTLGRRLIVALTPTGFEVEADPGQRP